MFWSHSLAPSVGVVTLAVFLSIAVLRPRLGAAAIRTALRRCGGVGLGTLAAAAAVATLLLAAALSLGVHWPIAAVSDEFCYLLSGDTFARGRLTNPPHPHAEFFDSWHLLVRPSYQAKYPPGQGVALAIGQWIAAAPLVGVWLSSAAAAAALSWAVGGWLPRRWAVVAVVLWLCNAAFHIRWGQSYWGGSVAMAAGALVIGAVPRFGRPSASVALGVGLVLLAVTRPFEGVLMSLPVAVYAGWRVVAEGPFRRPAAWAPAALILAVGFVGIAVYNRAVVGRATTMPYQVWTAQQGEALNRILTPAVAPVREVNLGGATRFEQHDRLRVAHLAELLAERRARYASFTGTKLLAMLLFYFGLPLLLLVPLVGLWPTRPIDGVVSVGCLLVLAGSCTHLSAGHPHYLAGLTTSFVLLGVQGARRLRAFRAVRPYGAALFRATALAWCVSGVAVIGLYAAAPPPRSVQAFAHRRIALEAQLRQLDDARHVVFVRYAPDHNSNQEWVYNGAEIDAQRVIWANDRGPAENRRLLDYYGDATGWLLKVGGNRERIERL